MRAPAFQKRINRMDKKVNRLRIVIEKQADPIEAGLAVAAIYLDSIATIRRYSFQLQRSVTTELVLADLGSPDGFARVSAILRIKIKLDAMLVKQLDRFLKCFGGPSAVGVQQIVKWASQDSDRGAWLEAFVFAMRRRRRS
jgi:hypothetical protein